MVRQDKKRANLASSNQHPNLHYLIHFLNNSWIPIVYFMYAGGVPKLLTRNILSVSNKSLSLSSHYTTACTRVLRESCCIIALTTLVCPLSSHRKKVTRFFEQERPNGLFFS